MGQFQHKASSRFFYFYFVFPVAPSGNNALTIGLCDFLGQPL